MRRLPIEVHHVIANYLFIADNLLLLVILRIGLLLANGMSPSQALLELNTQDESKILILLLKAITLANVVKFFLLPIIIWNNHTGDIEKKFNFTLVMGYFVYGLIHVYSGRISHCPKLFAINSK